VPDLERHRVHNLPTRLAQGGGVHPRRVAACTVGLGMPAYAARQTSQSRGHVCGIIGRGVGGAIGLSGLSGNMRSARAEHTEELVRQLTLLLARLKRPSRLTLQSRVCRCLDL
jgi:hypothetical protein